MSAVVERPETEAEAREWQKTNGHYLRAGLCAVCAAQAAYGHQLGFASVHPPCPECHDLVSGFELRAVNGWRKESRQSRRRMTVLERAHKATIAPCADPLPRVPYALRAPLASSCRTAVDVLGGAA